ncbi:MAG: UPF0182 family protein [Acidobacteriaceae bacterium]|jgi:uncharacterized membrane protein (UPF0182 family)
MPVSIDFPQGRLEPRGPRSPRLGRKLIVFLIVIAAILFAAKTALSYWVDLLWFRSLGYADVFWTTWRIEWGVFAIFAVATFVILYGAFLALKRASQASLPSARQIILGGQPVNLSIEPVLRIVGIVGSLLAALLSGTAMMQEWPTLALFWYAPHASGSISDPIFGRPLNFFLFTLPAWQLLLGWLLTLAVILCVVAVVLIAIAGGFSLLDKRAAGHSVPAWRGLSITVAFLLLVVAMNVFVSRFQCLLDHHTIFEGVNYTDAHVTIAGLLIVSLALLFGAVIALVNAARGARAKLLVASVVPAVFCYLAMSVVGWYVGNFIVKPNELVRETPYIANNIKFTQQAYGLDQFTQREFPAETTVDAADPANNQPTLQNIRLWDWHALQDTLRQEQEIRTYYDFPDIDIDRYSLDGTMREVMLAARELNVEKLPESSRNWINEKLVYTHGYGVTMNPVNGFTPEGLPTLLLSNMPVQSTVKGLNVVRPEIYFGELTDTDVYVKTRQQEFDFPQGQTNSVTSYQGTGGIVLGGLMRRILLAAELDDLGKLPFSDDVNPQSRLLMRRNIRDRVATLAPFLTFDQDPYIVVGDDGRLSWMMDAFTTSDSYPYSTHYDLDGNSINYMRNSVKVVIDAYNGTTTFYVFDNDDPVLAAYRRIFPSLFKDASLMPAGLRKHVRYPEKLFKLQAQVYGLYHMTNPSVFFNREDLWTVATETNGQSSDGQQTTAPMQPNFVLMKLPGETGVEFVEILPFTPANRNNLIGWIAGRCDPAHYGTSVVYDFPKTKLVDGPQQIESRIDQNAQLSGQLTLWNQQGSHVVRGSLLVIPSGKALLYAEPIYLQAQQSPMPELRLVVLALQDKLAYGPTFESALASLFGGETSSLSSTESAQAAPQAASASQPAPKAATDINGLIAEAGRDFADYQRLTAEGKLGEAGQKLDQLKRVLDQLNAQKK